MTRTSVWFNPETYFAYKINYDNYQNKSPSLSALTTPHNIILNLNFFALNMTCFCAKKNVWFDEEETACSDSLFRDQQKIIFLIISQ